MKWEKMQESLALGLQVFRLDWPDDMYVIKEEETVELFSDAHPEGVPYEPTSEEDLNADDWASTGPSGE